MDRDAALRLRDTMNSAGWPDMVTLLDGMISYEQEAVMDAMASRPDTLTGKAAIRHASRAKALKDFKQEILDSQQLLK